MAVIKNRFNIWLFQLTNKQLVTSHKRRAGRFRSVLFLFFLITPSAFAGFEDLSFSARYAARADAGIACQSGADALFINPACIPSYSKNVDVHLFYTKPFGLKELSLGTVAASFSHHRFTAAGGFQYFGNALYQEQQFRAAFSYQFLPAFTVGAACRFGVLSIQGYGQTHSIMLDAGAVARLSPKLFWGFSIKNASNTKIGVNQEALPTILTSGICLKPHQNFSLLFDLCKDTRFPMDIRCGIDYQVFEPLILRLGAATEPTRYSAGFSILLQRLRIDYAFSSHFDLGLTHMFSIGVF